MLDLGMFAIAPNLKSLPKTPTTGVSHSSR